MDGAVEAFLTRWQGREGGQERANYALFLSELCDVIGVERPEPASAEHADNDYAFERVVRDVARDGAVSWLRIDLYRRDRFVLEAKQSRLPGAPKALFEQPRLDLADAAADASGRGRRGAGRSWDVMMMNARAQAENYVRLLPSGHAAPPFVVVCDVGHCLELYANFRRDGKAYDQFPDRQSFRVYLEDLRDPAVRDRLRLVWTDPGALDPARRAAAVTRAIAARLAAVSRLLEAEHDPERVAMFLIRAIFTMFAEDVGLLPAKGFQALLERCLDAPDRLGPLVGQLWEAMDRGDFAFALEAPVPRFNGEFFRHREVLPLPREAIGELLAAAGHDWRNVEPAIFGTLLEQALDPTERRRLGAHYTPRAYVERLVAATVIEPLRADWEAVLATAHRQRGEGSPSDAAATVKAFHDRLCLVRVLDPACGTGNFLYVALELVKRLEGEVLEALADLGGQEALRGLESHTVNPSQFLGLEKNARAAPIAELVLFIGHLQWHFRTRGGPPSPPILEAYGNIRVMDAVLAADVSMARDADGRPRRRPRPDGSVEDVHAYANPRRPDWPEAEFIVGNPPFIGGKDLRARLGDDYVEALWAASRPMNESADFVMHWWDRAAEFLTRDGAVLRRFGFVTTNSITQLFQRRVIERRMKDGLRVVMAIPDHPWTRETADAAAVRIAMTVAEAGEGDGLLREVVLEAGLESDSPEITLADRPGRIHADLSVGVDVAKAGALQANEGICSRGVALHGAGFIVTPAEAEALGLGRRPGLEAHIRPYRNGRDLTARSRGAMVIDLFGLSEDDVRRRYPEVYQHVLMTVRPEREKQFLRSPTQDSNSYRKLWTQFGKPRPDLRRALALLPRYVATVETAKHRVFQFLDHAILPDNMIVAVGSDDGFVLGVLSSHIHVTWSFSAGGTLEDRPRYTKTRCFDPFPFPACDDLAAHRIRLIAEDLDAHRKARQGEHPGLSLTDMYNVRERLRAGAAPADLSAPDRRIFDDGLVLVLKDLHDRLDAAVAAAYGWPADLPGPEILARLVALNAERADDERRGHVRWLRPDYQIPRFGSASDRAELDLSGTAPGQAAAAAPRAPFPADPLDQMAAVIAALQSAGRPLDAATIAASFGKGRRVEAKITACLGALFATGVAFSRDGGRTAEVRRVA